MPVFALVLSSTAFFSPCEKSPVVDGAIEEGEYARGVAFARPGGTVFFAADSGSVFFAWRAKARNNDPGGGMVMKSTRRDDKLVCLDDAIDLVLENPDTSDAFHLAVNAGGNVFDRRRLAKQSWDNDWNCPGLKVESLARSGVWELEVSIPKSSLNLTGTRIRANVMRESPTDAAWAFCPGDFFDGGKLELDWSDVVPCFHMIGLGDPASGVWRPELGCVWAPEGAEAMAFLRLEEQDKGGAVVDTPVRKQKLIKAGWTLQGRHSTLSRADFRATVSARIHPGTKELYSDAIVARRGAKIGNVPPYAEFDLGMKASGVCLYYPGQNRARFSVVANGEMKSMAVTVAGRTASLAERSDGIWTALVDVPDERGPFEVSFAADDERYANVCKIEKRRFGWEDNKIGRERVVIPPFKPIHAQGACADVLLRTYAFDGAGLLASVKALGREILAAPVHFEVTRGSQTEVLRPTGSGTVAVAADGCDATFAGSAVASKLGLECRGRLEYDGFIWNEMTVTSGDAVDRLTLVVPMKDEESPLLHIVAADTIRHNPSGFVPQGDGIVFDSSTMYRKPECAEDLYQYAAVPYAWLGGPECGLSWFVNDTRGMALDARKGAVRIVRRGGVLRLECDFVNRPTKLAKGHRLTFGFEATPVKRADPELRRHLQNSTDPVPEGMMRRLGVNWRTTAFSNHWARVPWQGDWSKFDTANARPDAFTFKYSDPALAWKDEADTLQYRSEWVSRTTGYEGACRIFLVPSAIDFVLYRFNEWMDHGLEGLYFDDSYVIPCRNADTSGGSFGMLETRELMKRTAVMQHVRGVKPRLIQVHTTNALLVPAFAFATSTLSWEDKYGEEPFQKRFPIDYVLAESMGTQIGCEGIALDGIRRKKSPKEGWDAKLARLTRSQLAILLPAGMSVWCRSGKELHRPEYLAAYATVAKMKPWDAATEFLPFWKKPIAVPEGVIGALYRRDKDELAIFGNLTDEHKSFEFRGKRISLEPYDYSFSGTVEPVTPNCNPAIIRKAKDAGLVNVLYLGDSLSDFDRGSNHVDRLQGLLDAHRPDAGRIFNYAVRGDYIERLVKRLEGRKGTYELSRYADVWSRTYDLALVFLGHNDTRAYDDTNFAEPFMADEKVRAGYHRLVDILRGQGVGRIILVSPASPNFELCCSNAVKSLRRIAEGKSDKKRVARFGDPRLLDGFIKAARDVAAERGLEYLDFHDRMAALPDKASYVRPTDGVHLTQKGHAWIAAREFEYLTNGLKSVTAGWDNLNPGRRMPKPDKVYWSAPYEKGANGFTVSWREGATGTVEFAADCIRIRKTNDRGLVVITPVEPFEVPEKTELQAFVGVRTLNATDPDLARGYPRLWGEKEDLAYFKDLDGPQNVSSPLQEGLFSLAPGMFVRKLCHFRADASGRATPAIVVSGAPSETEWFGWGVEDFVVAKKAWRKRACSDREPPDRSATQIDEREFDARLASDVEHAAAMQRVGDEVRLLVDGKGVPPAIYKPLPFGMGVPFTGEGRMFAESGIGLQTVNVRLGGGDKRLGFWSKDGFDVAGAVKRVKDAMRAAPEALYFLTIRLDAYPGYADEHPDEQWRYSDGSPVYGAYSAGEKKPSATPPKGTWKWISNHSLVWRADVKRHLTTFIGALKAAGLSKRIVGIHLAGYHDGQFATMAPDYSKPAIAAFRRWQEARYGRVRWSEPPVYDAKKPLFDPSADEAQVAFQLFLKWGPFAMQEDVARHIRALFGKPIVIGRWCMTPFGGSFMAALDFTPFVKSDAIDFLVAQPVYPRRMPGVACGMRVPLASFRAHGKMFLNEFDLRTWHGRSGTTEPRSYWLSEVLDRPMWESTHRKLSGQMLANSMGWWYFDMADNWFGDPEIQADIASVQEFHRAHLARPPVAWRPSAAVLLDEEGCLLRNRIGSSFQQEEYLMTAEQLQVLASSGVPYDVWLMDDWLRDPTRADGYRYVLTMGVYAKDAARQKLLNSLAVRGTTVEASDGRLTPAEFNRRVRAAGGYVPARSGLQVDMSGDFLSVHCIIPGHYEFRLPRTCAVRNLKTGGREPVRDGVLPLDLVGGETCWFTFEQGGDK